VLVRLDPGLAFGTGSHPTTRLCLRWLERHLRAGDSVIDFGCGSGILAIAACKLGAGRVLGCDIDPQAIGASVSNARDNQCRIDFVESSQFESSPANIVVANILSNPLKLLAPMLASLALPGGALVLSGILERQSEELIDRYRPWIELSVWDRDEGWVCLAGRRAGARS
jgi:ribosomal protein L11 methyltransferase